MTNFLTIENLCEIFQVSQATIRRWVDAGSIPAPIRLGRRAIRWRRSDLESFIASAQTVSVGDAGQEQIAS